MSITLDDIEQMINNLRRVKYGDSVLVDDILTIKNTCSTIIGYLREWGWTEPELDHAEQKLNSIPPLKSGDIVSYSDRQALNDTIMYIDQTIKRLLELEFTGHFFRPAFEIFLSTEFSPDSKYVATGCMWQSVRDAAIYLLRVPTLDIVSYVPTYTPQPRTGREVYGVTFSPDGKYLALITCVHNLDTLTIDWYVETRTVPSLELVARTKIFEDFIVDFAAGIDISPDGKYVEIPASLYNSIEGSGVEIRKMPNLELVNRVVSEEWYAASYAKYSPDGKYIALCDIGYDKIVLLNATTLETIKTFQEEGWVDPATVDFSPDGRYLATALFGSDGFGILKVPELTKVNMKTKTEWSSPAVARFTPSGKYLIAIVETPIRSADGSIIDWTFSLEVIRTPSLTHVCSIASPLFERTVAGTQCVDISANGRYLAGAYWYGLTLLKERYDNLF